MDKCIASENGVCRNILGYGTPCDGCQCEELLKEAKETIRKLLCSAYGSSCQFCIHEDNENAMCRKVGGSGSWCCENAAWNGKSD